MKLAIVVACVLVATVFGDHAGHKHDHGDHDHKGHNHKDHYCYSKDAREIKREVCNLVRAVTCDAQKLFDLETKEFEKIMKERNVKSDEAEEEKKFASDEEQNKRSEMHKEIVEGMKKASKSLVKTVCNYCKQCNTKGCEKKDREELEGQLQDDFEKVMKPMDENYNKMMNAYLDDIEAISEGGEEEIDKESRDADNYLRKVGDKRVDASVKAVMARAKLVCEKMKNEEKEHERKYDYAGELSKAMRPIGKMKMAQCGRAMAKIRGLEKDIKETEERVIAEFKKKKE